MNFQRFRARKTRVTCENPHTQVGFTPGLVYLRIILREITTKAEASDSLGQNPNSRNKQLPILKREKDPGPAAAGAPKDLRICVILKPVFVED